MIEKHEIVAEHGKRLVISRGADVIERNKVDVAAWPDDIRSQRVWALSVAIQIERLQIDLVAAMSDGPGTDVLANHLALAERVLTWVNGEAS